VTAFPFYCKKVGALLFAFFAFLSLHFISGHLRSFQGPSIR